MKKIAMVLALASFSSVAFAGTSIFFDDFNADTVTWNAIPAGWTVSNGTVDVVGPGWWGNLCAPGQGSCVDLDGSTSQAGVLSKSLQLTAGNSYTASFDIAGNQRGGTDVVDIYFGDQSISMDIFASTPWATISLTFTPSVSGSYDLTFHNAGGDNVGAVLDNVNVSVAAAVPEPETYAMLMAGLGILGAVVRRRKPG